MPSFNHKCSGVDSDENMFYDDADSLSGAHTHHSNQALGQQVKCNRTKIEAFRPRLIYCPLFAWNAITGGKFIAPLLEQISPKFTDSVIGMTLSIQYAIVACLAGWGGRLADMEEKQASAFGQGRLKVMCWGVLLGTFGFLGHNLPQYVRLGDILIPSDTNTEELREQKIDDSSQWKLEFLWHIAMRILWAVSFALTAPAVDGLALAHLDCVEGKFDLVALYSFFLLKFSQRQKEISFCSIFHITFFLQRGNTNGFWERKDVWCCLVGGRQSRRRNRDRLLWL